MIGNGGSRTEPGARSTAMESRKSEQGGRERPLLRHKRPLATPRRHRTRNDAGRCGDFSR
jgi:hypothetical protein